MNTLKMEVSSITNDGESTVVSLIGDRGDMIIREPNLEYEVGQVVTVTVEQYD